MGGRGFCVKIELDLQAVTCPGVWLCPNGKVALRLNTLNSNIESRRLAPGFPLLYHDKFRFKKIFTGVNTLAELQNSLENEYLYTELVQWSSPKGSAVVLATFETNLADLLYPAPCFKGLLAGSEVDLLMEPTKYFPGILAPKIEVSTRTTIEEVTGIFETASGAHVINPKTINSKTGTCVHRKTPSKGIIRQRKVCHTQGKTQTQGNRPLRQRIPTTDETLSSPSSGSNNFSQTQIDDCCRKSRGSCISSKPSLVSRIREISPLCKSSHIFENCPVCSKYKCYFSHNHDERSKALVCNGENNPGSLHKIYDYSKCSRRCCLDRENDIEKLRPNSAPRESSLHGSSSTSVLRAKSRELQRQNGKSDYVGGDARVVDYFDCEKDQGRQGFYKNLEKFYKRMYKQAKIRAQEVNCS